MRKDDVSPDEDLEPNTPHQRQITQDDFEGASDTGSDELGEFFTSYWGLTEPSE